MAEIYPKSPIREAVCEFRFELEDDSPTDTALIHHAVKNIYPLKEVGKVVSVEFKMLPTKPESTNRTTDFDQFFSSDRKSMVQIDKGRLSIHRLNPYDRWDNFSEHITKVFQSYATGFKIRSIQRIGLRYVNDINIPAEVFDLEDYFNFLPQVPEEITNEIVSLFLGTVLLYENKKDTAKIQLLDNSRNKEFVNFVLDIDYALTDIGDFQLQNSLSWVERAHSNVEKIFKTIITNKTEQLFK